MLEKPELEDTKIQNCLRDAYDLRIDKISFLPLGADVNTAVYQVATTDGTAYFLKLRRGEFDTASVEVPRYLSDTGLRQIIPPLRVKAGQLWAELPPYRVMLYPYVQGRHGYQQKLPEGLWIEFGAALKRFHSTVFPPEITSSIRREDFSPRWRDEVVMFLERIESESFTEPAAAGMAAFLKTKRDETLELVRHAERLAQRLQRQSLDFIVCHGDIHGWNLLIDQHEALYIVDWDTLIRAPKERDLMFIGGGLADSGYTPQQEQDLFYQGYGPTDIHPLALAYYRFERIIEDIAAFCEQIFLSDDGGEDRHQALEYLKSNYLPGGTIEMAQQVNTAQRGWGTIIVQGNEKRNKE